MHTIKYAYAYVKELKLELADKLKLIRQAERLTQVDMADLAGIKLTTYKGYEYGQRTAISSVELFKILNHRRFQKYIFWFITGKTDIADKQISPADAD